MSLNPLRNTPRNADLGMLHESFFIAAVVTIVGIRTQLWLTHYPQLGGHGLHIAHLLWGGLLMTIALAILLSLLGRRARQPAAIIGGVGFGFFIDELGKFITADNNYFYKPAAAIIYLVFVGLFLFSRAYQRRRGLNEAERVRNAIELIGEATQGPFRQEYRDRALRLLGGVSADNPLREPLLGLAKQLETTPDPDPPWYQRLADSAAERYAGWTQRRWFHRIVIGVFVVWGLASIVAILGLVFSLGFSEDAARHGFESDSIKDLTFVNWASACSTGLSAALVVVGLGRLLRGDRLDAYIWLSRALLISIFVTRVFAFVESQFGALFGLAVDVLLLVSVRLLAQQERLRDNRSADASARRLPEGPLQEAV
ncbi:MAG: hypothetical protein WA862_11260 [Solirubrobacterales bacterium]